MRFIKKALPIILVFLLAPPLFSENPDVSSWFHNDSRARPYAGIGSEVIRVFTEAGKAGLSLALLMDKLKEGASKGVAADLLLNALRSESERLSTGRDILERQGARFSDPGDREETLRAISLTLIAGISVQTIESLFALAPSVARSSQEVAAAFNAMVQAKLSSRLTDSEIQRLGAALLKSRMAQAAFKSIPSFLMKASARGMTDNDVVDRIIVSVLESGGSLVQMEEELQKLTRGESNNVEKGTPQRSPPQTRPGTTSGSPGESAPGRRHQP